MGRRRPWARCGGRRPWTCPTPGRGRSVGEDRGRGWGQRRQGTTWSGLSGRMERVTRWARGVGAQAAARRGARGGYYGEARHILRVIGRDGDTSVSCRALLWVESQGRPRVFGRWERPGLRAPGAGSRTTGVWLRRGAGARGGGEKSWRGGMRGSGAWAGASVVGRGGAEGSRKGAKAPRARRRPPRRGHADRRLWSGTP